MSYIHNSTVSVAELEGSDKSCAVIAGMTKTAIDKEVKTRVWLGRKEEEGEKGKRQRAHTLILITSCSQTARLVARSAWSCWGEQRCAGRFVTTLAANTVTYGREQEEKSMLFHHVTVYMYVDLSMTYSHFFRILRFMCFWIHVCLQY